MPYRKKLIEVALPLEAINTESAREKSIRHGHPSTLHLWWARRPLAACRAVLFASLVDDPSEYMPDEDSANAERERLFDLIEDLVLWENVNNEEVLDKARLEIARSVARDLGVDVPVGKQAIREFLATKAPPVLDPFAGGGSIPLEAQRLGLRAYASDLNPVAVLINKALIEIPSIFFGFPPVHFTNGNQFGERAEKQTELWNKEWNRVEGLAEDVRYYGQMMRDRAWDLIGHLYPRQNNQVVIAWIWTRTVKSPNPAVNVHVPLSTSFWLSDRREKAWIEPIIDKQAKTYKFVVKNGNPIDPEMLSQGTKVGKATFRCLISDAPITAEYIRSEALNGRMGTDLMGIITESPTGRRYYSPNEHHESIADSCQPEWLPDFELSRNPRHMSPTAYGLLKHSDLYTARQLTALSTFSELISEIRATVEENALASGMQNDGKGLADGGKGAKAYAEAISVYLSFAVSRCADYWSTLAMWADSFIAHTFSRNALPIVWDFAEGNPFSDSTGNWLGAIDWIARVIEKLSPNPAGVAVQRDAANPIGELIKENVAVSTDPPYYDNVPYADLSDYFYIWLRKNLRQIYPSIFSTLLTPKQPEIVADSERHGGKEKAKIHFETGLYNAFINVREVANRNFPLSIYYAFKQTENGQTDKLNEPATSNTGWETMLDSLISSGYLITGTWPMRTERSGRMRSIGSNALASSIVLICRHRSKDAAIETRRGFLSMLKNELPFALRQLQQGSIAPVDLAQAAIGPGMAVFSRYKQVLEADGSPMQVRTALALINQALDEFLAEQEGEYDSDTRWALAWYEQYGHEQGPYGVAETLSKAKNTSVEGLVEAGFLEARAGKVRLLRRDELDPEWNPHKDKRPTAWEACQHLIYDLEKGGEQAAAALLAKLGSLSETARDLAYRLYTVCERKGWAQDALGYNMLVVAWPRLRELARSKQEATQGRLI